MSAGNKTRAAGSPAKKLAKLFLLAFVVMLALVALKAYRDAGEFKKLQYHSSLDCREVGGVLSSEDIVVDPRSGVAFISSVSRVFSGGNVDVSGGAIYTYDLNAETPSLVNATEDFTEEFIPHGIGLYKGEDGAASLFVINHRSDRDYVEIFDYVGGKLVHRRSVSGDFLRNPNDVYPSGPDSFYASNDHRIEGMKKQMVEDLLQLAITDVVYFNGDKFSVAAENMSYPNGVNFSPDGKTVYVTETISGKLFTFSRDEATGKLTKTGSIPLKTGLDNIDVDASGALWIGAHPKLLTFAKHATDQTKLSPSQILKITFTEDGGHKVDEAYLNDGSQISGSSVAAIYGKKVLIGSVFQPKFLVCETQ